MNGDGVSENPLILLPGTGQEGLIVQDGSTNGRFPVGSAGDVLAADPAEATGVKWATRTVTGAKWRSCDERRLERGQCLERHIVWYNPGDLMVHDGGTNVADGQVLHADSTQPAGSDGQFLQYDSTHRTA